MNIALGTLLLFLLVIPGIAFHKTFSFGPQTKQFSKLSAFDDFIWAIIPGVTFQLTASLFVNWIKPWNCYVDFESLGNILFGSNAAREFSKLNYSLDSILKYNVLLIFIAGAVGYICRKLISSWLKLDHSLKFLRFNNEWHYLLTGKFVFFQEYDLPSPDQATREKIKEFKKKQKIEKRKMKKNFATCMAFIVAKSEDNKLHFFRGYILRFHLFKDGELDTVWLTGTARCVIDWNESQPSEDEWIKIESHVLVIKGCEIVDLSVRVITFHEDKITPILRDPNPEQKTIPEKVVIYNSTYDFPKF